jgi:hypothetical protein
MSEATNERNLTTADVAAATKAPDERRESRPVTKEPAGSDTAAGHEEEQLVALFADDVARDFRSRWDAVQIGFVDDPKQAVHKADELVAQVMANLAQSFARERSELEGYVSGDQSASTENLRVALRRYRSFFQRLLSL